MSITPDRLLRMLHDSRARGHGQRFRHVQVSDRSGKDFALPTGGAGELPGGKDPQHRLVAGCVSKLRALGLTQVAAIFTWSVIPIAPLLSHLGIIIFGREYEDQPMWWQVFSSPELLASLSDQLHEE